MYGSAMATRPSPRRRSRRPIAAGALRDFAAAAKHLSFTLAAAELNLTQSSISRQIAELERQIGRPLFIRKTRALLLTAAGAQLQHAVQPALAAIDRCVDEIRGLGTLQRVSLTTYASFSSLWLAPRLALFQREHPAIEIRLDASDRLLDLEADDIDVAIRWVPPGRLAPDAQLPLEDVATPAISPRLLQGARVDAPADLAQWPLLELDRSVPGAQRLNWPAWFEFAGAASVEPAAGRLVFSFLDQAVQAAVRGQGVALVRSPFLEDCVASGDLVMPFPRLRMPAGARHVLVVNPATRRQPHVEAFVGWLAEQFRQAPRLTD